MSSNSKKVHPFAHETRKEDYIYYEMQKDRNLASDWDDSMKFCGTIGDSGKKMLWATLLLKKYSATQIANAFTTYHFKNKTMHLGNPFKCNYNDIFKAEKYLILIKWPMTEIFNKDNRSEWENDEEKMSKLENLVKDLEKGIPDYEIGHEEIFDME